MRLVFRTKGSEFDLNQGFQRQDTVRSQKLRLRGIWVRHYFMGAYQFACKNNVNGGTCLCIGTVQKYIHSSDVPINKACFFQSGLCDLKVRPSQEYINVLSVADSSDINPCNPSANRIPSGDSVENASTL